MDNVDELEFDIDSDNDAPNFDLLPNHQLFIRHDRSCNNGGTSLTQHKHGASGYAACHDTTQMLQSCTTNRAGQTQAVSSPHTEQQRPCYADRSQQESEQPTPFVVPGPAGALQCSGNPFASNPTHRAAGNFPAVFDPDFTSGPWQVALDALDIASFEEAGLVLDHTVHSILQGRDSCKVSKLLVLLVSLKATGCGDGFAKLKDPSGCIGAAIHQDALTGDFAIAPGAVLMLQNVSVVAPAASTKYLCITPNNILQVIPATEGGRTPVSVSAGRATQPPSSQTHQPSHATAHDSTSSAACPRPPRNAAFLHESPMQPPTRSAAFLQDTSMQPSACTAYGIPTVSHPRTQPTADPGPGAPPHIPSNQPSHPASTYGMPDSSHQLTSAAKDVSHLPARYSQRSHPAASNGNHQCTSAAGNVSHSNAPCSQPTQCAPVQCTHTGSRQSQDGCSTAHMTHFHPAHQPSQRMTAPATHQNDIFSRMPTSHPPPITSHSSSLTHHTGQTLLPPHQPRGAVPGRSGSGAVDGGTEDARRHTGDVSQLVVPVPRTNTLLGRSASPARLDGAGRGSQAGGAGITSMARGPHPAQWLSQHAAHGSTAPAKEPSDALRRDLSGALSPLDGISMQDGVMGIQANRPGSNKYVFPAPDAAPSRGPGSGKPHGPTQDALIGSQLLGSQQSVSVSAVLSGKKRRHQQVDGTAMGCTQGSLALHEDDLRDLLDGLEDEFAF